MTDRCEYFRCDKCGNNEFRALFRFSLRFYNVNFSDELMCDKINEELFECTSCGAKYTVDEINKRLQEMEEQKKA